MSSLRASAVSGVKWTGASTIVYTILSYGQLLVLARLLTPADFGLATMVTVVVGLSQAFADMGLSNAIIWKQDATRDQLSSLYWLNIASGVVLTAIILLFAPLISKFYKEPALINLIRLSALSFLVIPLGQQFQMLLQRELLFGRLAIIEVVAQTISVSVAVTTAVLGCKAYSIIYGQLANSAAKSMMLAYLGWKEWRPSLKFKISGLKAFIRFGLFQMGESTLNYFMTNIDYVMVGRFMGPETLGVYMLAYNLVIMPFTRINPILTRVAFPVFAKKQDDNSALARGYIELSKVISLSTLPILALIAATASVLIPVVFGDNWSGSIALAQILSILGLLRALNNPSGSIMLAKGRADLSFAKNIFLAALSVVIFWFAAQRGTHFMAWSEVFVTAIWSLVILLILRYLISMRILAYLRALVSPLMLSLCTGGTVYTGYILLKGAITNKPLLLGILLVVGCALFVALAFLTERNLIKDYWRYAIRKNVT